MHIADAIRQACIKSAIHETRVYIIRAYLESGKIDEYGYSLSPVYIENETPYIFAEGVPILVENPQLIKGI